MRFSSLRKTILTSVALFILSAPAVLAQTTPAGQKKVGSPGYGLISPLGNRSVPQMIGSAVQWLGGLAGSLFFIMLLWGGIQYMTAGGDGGKVKKAQARIVASVSGIIIILISYMAVATIIGFVPR
jgi:hypothetical protein